MRRDVEELAAGNFDVVVVGGGVHGAWVALRAAQAGYRVALLERDDFGAATSANALKILHGGLRYLQHLDFGRMRSSIRARREFSRLSPHLVQPLPCVMPLRAAGIRSPWVLGPALLANDLVAWDRNANLVSAVHLPRGRLTSARECRGQVAPLVNLDPAAGALWWDAVALDTGRLTLEPVLHAAAAGAVVANRVEALALLLHGGEVRGLTAADSQTGRSFEIKARMVVDAAGPWAGRLSRESRLPTGFLPPDWVGGMNVVLRRSLGVDVAVALSSSSKPADRSAVLRRATRELFFVPWRGVTMVGTDYHPVADRREAEQGPPSGALSRFLDEIAAIAPLAQVSAADVAAVHWGLLPLESAGTLVPRKSAVLAAGRKEVGVDGLIVVMGEKMTSAPVVSERVLRVVSRSVPAPASRMTRQKAARGHTLDDAQGVVDSAAAERLARRYGSAWPKVAAQAAGRPDLLLPIHPSVECLGVEIVHAVREEMALGLDDLVLRRVGLADAGDPGHDVLTRCAQIAAPEWPSDDLGRGEAVRSLQARLEKRRRG